MPPPIFELVVCITSSALFDSVESREIWKRDGFEAYKKHQCANLNVPMQPGVGYPLVQSLLALNEAARKQLVEVVLVSRKDSDSGERVRQSIYHYKLPITRMSFTGGTDVTKYLTAWKCDLFLTADEDQVRTVLASNSSDSFAGIAAALVCNIVDTTSAILPTPVPESPHPKQPNSKGDTTLFSPEVNPMINADLFPSLVALSWPEGQVRIAFDGDGVLFSDQAERIFKTQGLEGFFQFEREHGHTALPKGPMQAFALKLQKVRQSLGETHKWRVRTFLVTARNDVGNVRVFHTLKEWGLEIDETHFLGGLDKTPFLQTINPAIFFDDSRDNIDRAKVYVPSAQVVYGINNVDVNPVATSSSIENKNVQNEHST
ncbi:unnamed protein product [Rotaria magnacalcarata]|uniref:5'-nucleotidase n=4 Tax=Rotaria magnacalcarata TaxID=392030 RepID=A0A816YE73_9BILA|nr:unnamed protein product [Rotaria magnacalcarata]CAF2104083.1 unnamed protein product [Rotaria magnacalcarata]CAF2157613.1 unnamed protein product [Rotaria magnacalcarata]CAF4118717.1 unnamed protein product [Rotaria magnacalcarata]CAF4144812.1 unnamed protein product [Rotaria magnacalcarata]